MRNIRDRITKANPFAYGDTATKYNVTVDKRDRNIRGGGVPPDNNSNTPYYYLISYLLPPWNYRWEILGIGSPRPIRLPTGTPPPSIMSLLTKRTETSGEVGGGEIVWRHHINVSTVINVFQWDACHGRQWGSSLFPSNILYPVQLIRRPHPHQQNFTIAEGQEVGNMGLLLFLCWKGDVCGGVWDEAQPEQGDRV